MIGTRQLAKLMGVSVRTAHRRMVEMLAQHGPKVVWIRGRQLFTTPEALRRVMPALVDGRGLDEKVAEAESVARSAERRADVLARRVDELEKRLARALALAAKVEPLTLQVANLRAQLAAMSAQVGVTAGVSARIGQSSVKLGQDSPNSV